MRYVVVTVLIFLLITVGIVIYATSTADQRCIRMYPQANSFELEECTLKLTNTTGAYS